MPFYIGEFSKPIDASNIVHIQDPKETETLQVGQVVERWDHIYEWDAHCLKASQLEEWRAAGDPLCDAALEAMFTSASNSAGIDLLERLQTHAALNPDGPSQAFLNDVSRLPPEGIAASPREIREAQSFFLENSVAIMQSLMHFSLAGGFASPRITRVLQSVSYLVPPHKKTSPSAQLAEITPEMNERTYSRLLETLQFVLDVMDCTRPPDPSTLEKHRAHEHCLEPGGHGWKSAVRVRLLHGIARRRVLDRMHASRTFYSVEEDGIPINQEDMGATLGAFSVAPIWCLSRLYPFPIPPPTPFQASSFIATWRHIGFYLGVDPAILRTHFASYLTANKFLASTVVHLITSTPVQPGSPQPLFPTLPILLAASDRRPFPKSFEHHCALARHLLGPSLSTHLSVPPTPIRAELRLLTALFIAQIPVLFARIYPRRGWSVKRASLTREALARVVRFQMGMRRTTFRVRSDEGEVGKEVLAVEAVTPDPVGGQKMVSEYRAMMLEMAGVIAGVTMLLLASVGSCCALYAGWI